MLLIKKCSAYILIAFMALFYAPIVFAELTFEGGYVGSYTLIDDAKLTGSIQGKTVLFSDQFPSQDSQSSEDFVSNLYLGVGSYIYNWHVQAVYEYRYRFDINGSVGFNPKLAHIRANVNTQRLLFVAQRNISTWGDWGWDIGGGAGFVRNQTDLRTFDGNRDFVRSHSNSDFTWQLQSTVRMKLNDVSELTFYLAWVDLGSLKFGPQFDGFDFVANDYQGVDIGLGYRYRY
jgi:hypothetical protein